MAGEKVSIPRPPASVTPKNFFEDWLPATLAEMMKVIQENMGDLALTLGFRVTGADGGDWSVVIVKGGVSASPGIKPNAAVTLALSRENFFEAVIGERDDLLPGLPWLKKGGQGDPAEIGKQIRNGAKYLEAMKGTILFRAEDPARPFSCLLQFHGETKTDPDTTITIDQEVLREIGRGETTILNAFMSGHIKIGGAMHLILQFASLVMK